jgi:hypothetical protein
MISLQLHKSLMFSFQDKRSEEVDSQKVTRVLPERTWNGPSAGTYQVDLASRLDSLAKRRFQAAKGALSVPLVDGPLLGDPSLLAGPLTLNIQEPILNIEEVLNRFDVLQHKICQSLTKKTDLVLTLENQEKFTIAYRDVKCLFNGRNYKLICNLAEGCRSLSEMLNRDESKITPEDMKAFRQKINELLKTHQHSHPAFSWEVTDSIRAPFIQFLDALSYQINTQAKGMDELETLGSAVLKDCCGQEHLMDDQQVLTSDISNWAQNVFTKVDADRWDTGIGYIGWAIKNLKRAFLAFIDNHIPGAHRFYNSYALGNANMWIGDFKVGGKNIRFNLGPSPTTDALFEAQLRWQKKRGEVCVVHTLEFNHKRGEAARLLNMRDRAGADPNHFILYGTPLDGECAKGKGNFKNIKSVEDFHTQLSALLANSTIPKEIKEYTGFANPVLESEEIEEALKASKEAFEELLKNKDFEGIDKRKNHRLCKAMLLGFTGFLVIKTLLKMGNSLNEKSEEQIIDEVSATMAQCCKQDIDRGPIVNAVTIAYIQMIKQGSLKGKDAKQIIGTLLMRALMVDERLMVKGRLEAFLDLFQLIGGNEGTFVRKLQAFAGKEEDRLSPIEFISSNSLRG